MQNLINYFLCDLFQHFIMLKSIKVIYQNFYLINMFFNFLNNHVKFSTLMLQHVKHYSQIIQYQVLIVLNTNEKRFHYFSLYNINMFGTNQVSHSVTNLFNEIKDNQSFKFYHQSLQSKGFFAIIRNSFEEMVIQLQKFIPTQGNGKVQDIYKRLLAGRKIWAYYQFKMFAWIVAWQRFQNRNSSKKSIDEEIQLIQRLFPSKCQQFLKYEYTLIISKAEKIKCFWIKQQIDVFSLVVIECQKLSSQRKNDINWKFVSFKLFVEHGVFKTPNECRERWSNHLNPKLNKTKWDPVQDLKLLQIYQQYGPKWAFIARKIKNRTQHMVKNRFNSIRHKWMKEKKPSTIFNINLLIKDTKFNIKKLEEDQLKGYSEGSEESSNNIIEQQIIEKIEGPQSPKISMEQEQLEDIAKEQVFSQISEVKYEESSQNIRPAMLSLADVGGQIQLTKNQRIKSQSEVFIDQRKCYEMLLDEPLWKNSDRIPTADFQWLDEMIEQRNIQEFDEFI